MNSCLNLSEPHAKVPHDSAHEHSADRTLEFVLQAKTSLTASTLILSNAAKGKITTGDK